MGYTLLEARTRIRVDFIDEPTAKADRWEDAEIDRHLKAAQARVLAWAISNGFKGLRSETEFTITSNVIPLEATSIIGVQEKVADCYYSVKPIGSSEKVLAWNVGGTFVVVFDAIPAFPTLDAEPLVDHAGTNMVLEELILFTAIQYCGVKDEKMPIGIARFIEDHKAEVLMNKGTGRIQEFPKAAPEQRIRYEYDNANRQIVLSSVR